MEILNNISPLPFYADLQQQHHRKSYAFGQIYPLMISGDSLLPFQFMVDIGSPGFGGSFSSDFNNDFSITSSNRAGLVINDVLLHFFNTSRAVSILGPMNANGLTISNLSSGPILVKYPGEKSIADISREGLYYIEFQTSQGPIYSDIFVSSNNLSNCIKLIYYNSYSLNMPKGLIDFSNDFKFVCYLDTIIGKPEYIFEETVSERGGYSFVESQISKKVYRFTCLAPEYLCDALRIIRLCNNKHILSDSGSYDLFSFSMMPKWEEQGDLASVECEFETDTVIVNIGNIK